MSFKFALRRAWSVVGFLGVFWVVFATTPLSYYYGRPLLVDSNPLKSDAIVLMSSSQLGGPWLSMDAAQRTLGALKLYKMQIAPWIVSSGSNPELSFDQAGLQADWLVLAGVPRESILIDRRSSRTYESCLEIARLMKERGWQSVTVVTSDLDIPRIRLVCKKLHINPSYLAVPEYRPPRQGLGYGAIPFAQHATYEYLGLLYYRFRGWI